MPIYIPGGNKKLAAGLFEYVWPCLFKYLLPLGIKGLISDNWKLISPSLYDSNAHNKSNKLQYKTQTN